MDNGVVEKYEQGIALFEEGRYEEAVACFICAYESRYMQAEILQNIYNCFVTPNIQEFQDNYNMTGAERYGVKCEDTVIDFIPVAEYTFYIWHKKQKKFLGLLDVADIKKPVSKSFQSLFIEDGCNMDDLIKFLTQKNWNHVYVLLNGEESELLSFCKLPLFFTQYLKDAVFFKSEEELKSYFKNSENYLPHKMCTDNEQYYNALFEEIHNERINEIGEERNNIFLSVCIPTWNRGLLALDAVKNILLLSYDAEIEVVVSNNGSDKTQGYDELKEIKDSRLRYYELDSNMGFAYNFRNVLGKAKGKFAVMCSDEDLLKLDAFPEYLDFLKENDDVRFFTTSGDGQGFKKDESCIYEEGTLSYSEAINANYITGTTFNNEYMRKNHILEVYDEMKEQAFIFHYPHCALAVMAVKGGKAGFCNINLWTAKEPEEAQGILEYMKLEHRIEQQNYAISFFSKIVTDQLELMDMISIWMYKTYHLLRAGFQGLPEVHMERYNWLDVCLLIYDSQIKLIKEYSWMQEDVKEVLNELAYNNFIEFVMKNPVRSFQTEHKNPVSKSFQSLFIADDGNIEEKLRLLMEEKWNKVYILLNGKESVLLSFCKLPRFFKQYLEDAVFFKSEEDLKSYFKNSENYLPREICAGNVQYWNDFFEEIHNERIGNVGAERGNIFLSICIPTWNRGLSALHVVKNILSSSYDTELEVVVSNNGSDKTEGYDELKEIKDSRLKYYEFDSNRGFACNFRNVLGMAGGRFAVTCSDEDLLCLDELPKYLDVLFNNMDVRFITTSGVGPNFRDSESRIFSTEIEANNHAINANYITGATFNIKYMRENKIFDKYDELSGLSFIHWYAQCVMAAIATKGGTAGFFNVKLWQEGGTDEETGMLQYMKLENRIKQQNDAAEFCNMLYNDDNEMFLSMMLERMYKTYLLLNVGFYWLPKEFMNEYKWTDVCLTIYKSHLELISKYSGKAEGYMKRLKEIIFNDFSEFVLKNPVKSHQTEQESLLQEKISLAIQEKIKQGIMPDDISTKELEETIKASL